MPLSLLNKTVFQSLEYTGLPVFHSFCLSTTITSSEDSWPQHILFSSVQHPYLALDQLSTELFIYKSTNVFIHSAGSI